MVVPIYNREVRVFVVRDIRTAYERIAPQFALSTGANDKCDAGGFLTDGEGLFGTVIQYSELDESVISHEMDHIADELLAYIGYKGKGEPKAYLVGYLNEWIRKEFKKAKVKVK